MWNSGGARTLALGLALAGLVCADAHAQRADVESWSVDWAPGFTDLFDDGVFTSGPGQLYNVGCPASGAGVVEAGGLLTVPGVSFPCKGFEVQPNARIPGGATMRALFETALPPIGASYGLVIKNLNESDAAYLLIRRGPDPNGTSGSDTLFVELAADATFTPVAAIVLSVNPAGDPQLPERIELELTLTPNAVDGTLLPSARYSECGAGVQPCSPRPALLPLPPVTSPPPDGGALAAGVLHIPAFKEVVPPDPTKNPFPVSIEDWSIAMSADDDFETAPLGAMSPYQTSTATCGSAVVEDGALALDLEGSCPKVVAAFLGSLASDLDASANFRFAIPERCERYGVGASAQTDLAELALVRDGTGELAVWLTTEPEAGDGPALPILEYAHLSATPVGDPTLAGVEAVELRLLLEDDGFGGRIPHGQFRLCETSPCAAEVAFEDLAPTVFLPPPPTSLCGIEVAERGLPTDGGAFAGDVPVTANLFALAPEPAAGATAAAAIAALHFLRRRRS